ncbi:hypothetical protein ABZY19_38975 [Streptomyces sp. NPDC006475]|uniref:hypothetical protein n=1 Tax=Streptomyces sp. NPDC006475 TaxID=3155719 RepID=UPI0033A9CB8A
MRGARVCVRCGLPGPVRALPELSTAVVEVRFGRVLARNETTVVDCTVRAEPGDGTDDNYERRTAYPDPLAGLSAPGVLPPGGPAGGLPSLLPRARHAYNHRLLPHAWHSVHSAPGRCPAGIHGVSWRWPGPAEAGG